jgi:ABC-type nitrate/sulfonate/bicarbonate transport system substrate-binding protein
VDLTSTARSLYISRGQGTVVRIREFPVLGGEDEPVVETFAAGLDREAARVLAYLIRRQEDDRFSDRAASRLAVRVGVDLGRGRVSDVLSTLTDLDLVTETTVDTEAPGRPPKGWRAATGREPTARRVRALHSANLVDRAAAVAATLGVDVTAHTETDPSSRPPDTLAVGLNWTPNGLHAPLFAAARGAYADHGVDVTLTGQHGSRDALAAVADGETDVALAGAATVLRVHEASHDLVPVALCYQRAPVVLYTTREAFGGPLRSVEDVRGRRVAMPAGAETGTLSRLFLSQAGVVDDVTVVRADGEEHRALLYGEADVATGVFVDPLRLEEAGYDVDSLLVADHFPVPGPAFVVRPETLRDRTPAIRGFLEGTMVGWTDARLDPEAAAAAVVDEAADSTSAAAERRTFEHALARFAGGDAVEKHGWGWHSPETWHRLQVALRQAEALVE